MDMGEIEREIRKIEADRTTWNNCERLSVLYTVRNNQPKPEPKPEAKPEPQYSFAAEPVGDSDFLRSVQSADINGVLRILDKHMDDLRLVYPKEYALIMRKISEI